jgi:hypothetical protein
MPGRNIDDIDKELERLMSLTENGGGYGCLEEKEVDDRKIQVLLSLRQQEIIRNESGSNQEQQSSGLDALDRRIDSLVFLKAIFRNGYQIHLTY